MVRVKVSGDWMWQRSLLPEGCSRRSNSGPSLRLNFEHDRTWDPRLILVSARSHPLLFKMGGPEEARANQACPPVSRDLRPSIPSDPSGFTSVTSSFFEKIFRHLVGARGRVPLRHPRQAVTRACGRMPYDAKVAVIGCGQRLRLGLRGRQIWTGPLGRNALRRYRPDFEEISDFSTAALQSPCRQLKDASRPQENSRHTIGRQSMVCFNDSPLAVQVNRIDRESHPDGMDSLGRGNPEPLPNAEFV